MTGTPQNLTRVPCTIVTGFLGAGKTTLIRHVIANAQGRRLAVIVNEFGDVGIDGEILKGCGLSRERMMALWGSRLSQGTVQGRI